MQRTLRSLFSLKIRLKFKNFKTFIFSTQGQLVENVSRSNHRSEKGFTKKHYSAHSDDYL